MPDPAISIVSPESPPLPAARASLLMIPVPSTDCVPSSIIYPAYSHGREK
jgi:hypothetical protein